MPETATGPEQRDLQPEHEEPEPEPEPEHDAEPSHRPRLEARVWPKGSTPAWAAAAGWGARTDTAEQQEAGAAQTPTGK